MPAIYIPYFNYLTLSISKLMPPGQQILVQAFSLQLYQAVVLLGVHVGGADAVPRGGVYGTMSEGAPGRTSLAIVDGLEWWWLWNNFRTRVWSKRLF